MDEALRPYKALSREILGRLVPHEDIIYCLEDVLLFQYPARAAVIFLAVNLPYALVAWLCPPSPAIVLSVLALFLYGVGCCWLLSPRTRILTRLLRVFVGRSVRKLERGERRFEIAEVTAFAVTGIWAAVQIWRDAASAAKQRQFLGIAKYTLGFLVGFIGFAMLGDAIVLWLVINGTLLLPWICCRLRA
jgi:hypothetical protein